MKKLTKKIVAFAAKITGAISIFMLFMLFSTNVFAQIPYARIEYENKVDVYEYYPDPYNAGEYINYHTLTGDAHLRLYEDVDCSIPYFVTDGALELGVDELLWLGANGGGNWASNYSSPDNIQIWGATINNGENESYYTYYSRYDHMIMFESYNSDKSQQFTYILKVRIDSNYPARYTALPTVGISW